jgi:hypothetical protein
MGGGDNRFMRGEGEGGGWLRALVRERGGDLAPSSITRSVTARSPEHGGLELYSYHGFLVGYGCDDCVCCQIH